MIIVVKIFHFHLVAAREDLKDDYCFICIVLSYGQDGVITCYDETHSPKDPTADMQLPVSELQGCLKGDKCKKLLLKPKIFMLQVLIMYFNSVKLPKFIIIIIIYEDCLKVFEKTQMFSFLSDRF